MSHDPKFASPIANEQAQGERGASIVEYAFLVLLIAIVAIVAVTVFGQRLSTSFSTIAGSLAAAN